MFRKTLIFALLISSSGPSGLAGPPASGDLVDALLNRIVAAEQDFLVTMQEHSPLMEVYLQGAGESGGGDQYAIGRVAVGEWGVDWTPFSQSTGFTAKKRSPLARIGGNKGLLARGFAQMIVPDAFEFDRRTYRFKFLRREFLGGVRCFVFEVSPRELRPGKFVGRIWVEEREARIVRFNGTYSGSGRKEVFFHFDSWRLNVEEDFWAPAYVYIQDQDQTGALGTLFSAQARLWHYKGEASEEVDELATILIEQNAVEEETVSELSPLEAERQWRREAQRNVLRRLESAGLLAPRGDVDELVETVVRNLMAANGIALDIECRVLLTTPLETFSIGQAIVISRGLLDVLPDEASLAMALSTELAHASLGHRMSTMYSFADLTMFDDREILSRLRLARPADEVAQASAKAIEVLRASTYSDELGKAGLFLQALESRSTQLPELIRSNFGNALAADVKMGRLQPLSESAPALEEEALDQIAALPLGSRVKLDPWSNRISLLPVRPVEIRTAEDKLPFKVTPFLINLQRAAE